MRSSIVKRLEQLKVIRESVSLTGNDHVDKASYLRMIDMNIEALTDIVTLIEYVKDNNSEKVEQWFDRFK